MMYIVDGIPTDLFMKQLLFILYFLFAASAFAQDINNIQYTVTDTLQYEALKAPVRRTTKEELEKYLAKGGKNFAVAKPLMKLEEGLTNAMSYMMQGKKNIPWIPHLHNQVTLVRKEIQKFNMAEYEKEIAVYEAYNKNMELKQQEQYSNIDSIRKVKEAAESQRRFDEEAALKRKEKVKQQNADSVKMTFEKMMSIAAENEAKAQKAHLIKTYGVQYGELIAKGQVKPGMTQEMCIESIGEPVSKIKSEDGTETWQYLAYTLSFKEGKLKKVDSKK